MLCITEKYIETNNSYEQENNRNCIKQQKEKQALKVLGNFKNNLQSKRAVTE